LGCSALKITNILLLWHAFVTFEYMQIRINKANWQTNSPLLI